MGLSSNVGRRDRLVRAVIAGILIYLALFIPDVANDVVSSALLLLVATLFIFVAISGYCPIYRLLDIDTRCVGRADSEQ